jgi:CubicO group peptidase (beta-lactamase class C family)
MRFVWALFAIALATAAQASAPSDAMREFIAAEMRAAGTPGLALAIVEDGETVTGGYGEALIGSGRAVTPDTPFAIGSISKSITAMAVMQLVESEAVDLDTPVSNYVDVFQERASGAITIRQLLSHTSGFSTRQGNDIHRRGSTGVVPPTWTEIPVTPGRSEPVRSARSGSVRPRDSSDRLPGVHLEPGVRLGGLGLRLEIRGWTGVRLRGLVELDRHLLRRRLASHPFGVEEIVGAVGAGAAPK